MRAFTTLIIALAVLSCSATITESEEEGVGNMLENLRWLGHSAFRIDGAKTVYFDPFRINAGSKKADLVFVSHEHYDHCSPDDIKLIAAKDTVIVCDKASEKKLKGAIKCKEVKGVSAGDKFDIEGIRVEVVPAYNINKKYHPKGAGYVGYIVTLNGVRFYHAGDTDLVPEMKDLKCDVALLPISGTYVMTADEAAKAALLIKPKVAIPMHYGEIIGTEEDANRFAELLKGKIEVKIMDKEQH